MLIDVAIDVAPALAERTGLRAAPEVPAADQPVREAVGVLVEDDVRVQVAVRSLRGGSVKRYICMRGLIPSAGVKKLALLRRLGLLKLSSASASTGSPPPPRARSCRPGSCGTLGEPELVEVVVHEVGRPEQLRHDRVTVGRDVVVEGAGLVRVGERVVEVLARGIRARGRGRAGTRPRSSCSDPGTR